MTVLQKFMFDRSFDSPNSGGARRKRAAEQAAKRDADDAAKRDVETTGGAAEPEAPPAPTFSDEDIAAARAQGYLDGKQAGNQEAWTQFRTQTDQMAVRALKVIGEKMQTLVDDVQVSNQIAYRDAVILSVAVVQKLFPILAERGAIDEVEAVITECLHRLHPEPRVVIKVNGYIADALQDRLEPLIDEMNFAGQLVLEVDDDLAETDCAVAWTGGGAARNGAAMWTAINAALEQVLGIDAAILRDSEPIGAHERIDHDLGDLRPVSAAGREELAPELLEESDDPEPRDEHAMPVAGTGGPGGEAEAEAPDDDLDLEVVP